MKKNLKINSIWQRIKKTKADKENGTVTTTQVNIVNGKVVATEELDKAILDNFGECPSMHYFEPQEEDY